MGFEIGVLSELLTTQTEISQWHRGWKLKFGWKKTLFQKLKVCWRIVCTVM